MFVELNEIRGFVIFTDNVSILNHLIRLTNQYKCTFVFSDQRLCTQYASIFSLQTNFLLKDITTNSVFQALTQMNLQPYEVSVISDNLEILSKAQSKFRVGTILINESLDYSQVGEMPDYFLKNADNLDESLNKYPGYFGEVNSTVVRSSGSSKQLFSTGGIIFEFQLKLFNYSCRVISCGRYYNPRHAFKNRVHQLSYRIRKSKSDSTQSITFENIFHPVVNSLKVDAITRVPPRPGESRDRFANIVDGIANKEKIKNFSKELKCIADYPKQKGLNHNERILNVQNKFVASEKVEGKRIVLIDDVFTTGSTAGECARTLIEAGAKEVIILVLAVNQFEPFNPAVPQELDCPEGCGGTLSLRMNRNGIGFFYGCSNYFNEQNKCNGTMFFTEGWSRFNSLNVLENSLSKDESIF
ncbi:phosphoribosyltransferase family protein [Paenibacillus illinoisensis]|uniref:phosphoribosyltransferase family protein n=1 Tax=Paenibacillus illinoisensis TaxID=59845 RepID=UPI00301C975A